MTSITASVPINISPVIGSLTMTAMNWIISGFPQLFSRARLLFPTVGAVKQGRIQSLANVAMFTLLSRGII